jgi:glycosyltransferase involved in cell wall biosynthesis
VTLPPKTHRPKHIAYLVNQYPQVSHTFIRREILALEKMGIRIKRIAVRGWDDRTLVDAEDLAEREKTRYVLKGGLASLFMEALRFAVRQPGRFLSALGAAISMSRGSIRPLPYHLIWVAQACLIKRWIEESGAEHLHAHFGTNPAEIACLVRVLGGPTYSFTIHGRNELDGAPRLHFPRKVESAAFVVAVSAYCRSQIMREVSYRDWEKLKVVHCGLTADYFENQIPAPTDQVVFLIVGRLSPEKGHLILLDAFASVSVDHPEVTLVIAGDGPMRLDIKERIADLGLSYAVRFTGWIDATQVRSEIDAATVLVQPSLIEGLPVVIMEAMARKRAVISTYVAGIPELVVPGETGWLVPAGDTAAMANAMREAVVAAPETLRDMGDAGLERAKDRHSVAIEAEKLARLFDEAIK